MSESAPNRERKCRTGKDVEALGRGSKRICLPIERAEYDRVLTDPVAFRQCLDVTIGQYPELFPNAMGAGYTLHDILPVSKKMPRLLDPHWREVILLLLGSLNKFEQHPTELVRRIFESTDRYEPVLHRHLYLAARTLADHVEVESKLHRAIVDRLMALVNTQEWWISDDAFAVLGALEGDSYAAGSLLTLAQDPQVDAEARRDAAQALGRLGRAREAVSILLALA